MDKDHHSCPHRNGIQIIKHALRMQTVIPYEQLRQ